MSQYSLIVHGLYCRGLDRRLCHNTKFCIVTVDWARWAPGRACWAPRLALGARLGEQAELWGGQAAGALGRQARRHDGVCEHERAPSMGGRACGRRAGARGT